jgi:hypothetical protein
MLFNQAEERGRRHLVALDETLADQLGEHPGSLSWTHLRQSGDRAQIQSDRHFRQGRKDATPYPGNDRLNGPCKVQYSDNLPRLPT